MSLDIPRGKVQEFDQDEKEKHIKTSQSSIFTIFYSHRSSPIQFITSKPQQQSIRRFRPREYTLLSILQTIPNKPWN
jgi:hypothetical protein